MKRNIKFSTILIAIALSIACASTQNLTKSGKNTYYADEVVRDLGLLQSTFIKANDAGKVSEDDTRLVVTSVKATVGTLKTVPDGWKVTVSAAVDNLEKALSENGKSWGREYFTTIRTVLSLVE